MRTRRILLIITALIMHGTNVPAGLSEALRAMNTGNYAVARKEFTVLAEQGDDRAMVTLGVMYDRGEGVPEDNAIALEWYFKALDKGNADAMNNIGVMYREAHGLQQDLEMAYALLRQAIKSATSDECLGRATRNLEKLNSMISAEQLARAQKITAQQLTSAYLRTHKPGPEASRQVTHLISPDALTKLPSTYEIDPAKNLQQYAGVAISGLYNDGYQEMPGMLGMSSGSVKDVESAVKDGVYRKDAGRFAVRVPRLATGKIAVRQTELRQGMEFQVRLFDHGTDPFTPWGTNSRAWHAVVVVLQLTKAGWKGTDVEALGIAREMQTRFISGLPAEHCTCTLLSGPWGPIIQTVVLNRVPSNLYPQSEAKVSPPAIGLNSIGINRVFCRDGLLVELGLIIAKPQDLKADEFPSFAATQMDIFMSGLELLPPLAK